MAQVNFNDVDFNSNSGNNSYRVGFFNLKNDGDEAVVRIMHDSVDTFEILTTHEIREDGKYRGRVNCLRNPREDLSKCPLCAANVPLNQRIYIHLIHYVPDQNGNIIPQAEVWERSVQYATRIKSYIDNYGPMSDVICKIIRHGKPGDQQTTYEIIPNLNKQVYRDDIYVKDNSLFEGYSALGTVVQDRNFEELTAYLNTGHMPQKQQNQNTIPTSNPQPNAYAGAVPAGNIPAYNSNVPDTGVPFTPGRDMSSSMPASGYVYNNAPRAFENNNQQLQRPTRSYY